MKSKFYKTPKVLENHTQTLINLYRAGKELDDPPSISRIDRDRKDSNVISSIIPHIDDKNKRQEWENAVLSRLSFRDKFFFNNLPFREYKESFLHKDSLTIEKRLHLWRLEFLYGLILHNLENLDILRGNLPLIETKCETVTYE